MQPTKIHLEAVRADWAGRGFTCELWIDPPNQVWHDFEHDVDELVLLIEGACQIELPGRTVRMQAGDELTIPAGTRHTVRNCGDGPARWLHGYPCSQSAPKESSQTESSQTEASQTEASQSESSQDG